MKQVVSWLKKVAAKSVWDSVVGACIAINLIHYQHLDLFFVAFAILATYKAKTQGWKTALDELSFKSGLLNTLIIAFVIAGAAGYLQFWPLNDQQISEISQLRWILGIYCCIYAGSQIGKLPSNFFLSSSLPVLTMAYLLLRQSKGYWGLIDIRNRMLGFYENPNHLGLALLLPWAFFLGFLAIETWKPSKRFVLHMAFFIGATITLVATFSRSSWLAGAIVFLVTILYTRRKSLLAVAIAGLFTSVTAVYFNVFGLLDRLLSTDLSTTGVEAGRIAVWKVSWQIFLDHPFFGVGIDQASNLYASYYEKLGIPTKYMVGHAHNQYLQILAGTGLVGFGAYAGTFALAWAFFHKTFRNSQNESVKAMSLAGVLVIVALFSSSITDAPFRLQECRNYVLLLLGLAFGYCKTKFRNPTYDKT